MSRCSSRKTFEASFLRTKKNLEAIKERVTFVKAGDESPTVSVSLALPGTPRDTCRLNLMAARAYHYSRQHHPRDHFLRTPDMA
jgi:hypothetical protein